MSRRYLFMAVVFVVMLYFTIILFMLNPLHSARGFAYSNFPYKQVRNVEWCRPLNWKVPPGDVVALASYPGSGNTWLRYLLQQVTGIMTGSIYMDHDLRLHGFPAESVKNGSVLVVKTHEAPDPDRFKSAILLLRNPRDALLAEFNRLHMGHIGTAPKSAFRKKNREKPTKDKPSSSRKLDWDVYVSTYLEGWESLNKMWLHRFPGAIHVVFYETLVRDTERALADTLAFLAVSYTEEDLICALAHSEGIYRRRKKHKNFDPFTPEMYQALDSVKNRVLALVNEYKSKHNRTHS